MIKIVEYKTDKDLWNSILGKSSNSSFINSLDWLEFQETNSRKVEKYFIKDDSERTIGLFAVEVYKRKFVKYANLPYGPVLIDELEKKLIMEVFVSLKNFGKKFCKKNNVNTFRVDPYLESNFTSLLNSSGWKSSKGLGQPKNPFTWDISKSEEELLKELKKETRYYVKKPEKEGVIVKRVELQDQIEDFVGLMQETETRNGFVNHPEDYYKRQWGLIGPNSDSKMCDIFIAYYNSKPVAGALMNYFNKTISYSHGASASDKGLAKLAAPYFLHWEIVKYARTRGITFYNFWGVIPKEISNHPWRGLSDFKMKFPGNMQSLTGPFEVYNNFFGMLKQRVYDWWVYRNERY